MKLRGRIAGLVGLVGSVGAGAIAPAANAQEAFLGEVREFGFTFCPRGWASADGSLLQISQNTALFSLLGTTYGGDGRATFALPKVAPVQTLSATSDTDGQTSTPQGKPLRVCVATEGIYPSRN